MLLGFGVKKKSEICVSGLQRIRRCRRRWKNETIPSSLGLFIRIIVEISTWLLEASTSYVRTHSSRMSDCAQVVLRRRIGWRWQRPRVVRLVLLVAESQWPDLRARSNSTSRVRAEQVLHAGRGHGHLRLQSLRISHFCLRVAHKTEICTKVLKDTYYCTTLFSWA